MGIFNKDKKILSKILYFDANRLFKEGQDIAISNIKNHPYSRYFLTSAKVKQNISFIKRKEFSSHCSLESCLPESKNNFHFYKID